MGFIERDNKIYVKFLADGTVRIPAEEGAKGAVKRIVELSDGSKKEYNELVKSGISGIVEEIDFKEKDFGKMMNITFRKEKDQLDRICLSMHCSSNFATDVMEKLPNCDLAKEVTLSPWCMTNAQGKMRKGVVVLQGEEKISSFFKKYEEGNPKPQVLNDFPEVKEADAKTYDKDDWKMYFTNVKKFLVKYTEENILPALAEAPQEEPATEEEQLEENQAF